MLSETIHALATPPGRGGVAMVRVSGPAAQNTIRHLTGHPPASPRRLQHRRLKDPDTGDMLDQALVVFFSAPESFTGEDIAEFHLHGGPAVVAAVLAALTQTGSRLAEPGEFTRRAFLNNRLDLTEVEGLADLIAAETATQHRQALRLMQGELARQCTEWRDVLTKSLAHLEAAIDFADEDIPASLAADSATRVRQVAAEIASHLTVRHGERLREGISVVLVGPANAGKSSLLNHLARRDIAIVAPRPGTTRDLLETAINLDGWPVVVSDGAGLRPKDTTHIADPIEEEGVLRLQAQAEKADLRVILTAPDAPGDSALMEFYRPGDLQVFNKSDLKTPAGNGAADFLISVKTGDGMEAFLKGLAQKVATMAGGGDALITRARQREALQTCHDACDRAAQGLTVGGDPELPAEDLRLALRALGRLAGRVDVEDLLDVIFADFCLGK